MGFTEWKAFNCNHAYMNAYYFNEHNKRFVVEGYEPAAQTDLVLRFMQNNIRAPWGIGVFADTGTDTEESFPSTQIQVQAKVISPNVKPDSTRSDGLLLF